MQIGDFQIHVVENGSFGLDGGAMFGVVPKQLWDRANPADEKNRIKLSLRSLLLTNRDRKILIDTGIGTKFPGKEMEIYAISHQTTDTHNSLKKLGLSEKDITDVFITHLHFDHVGGSTFLDSDNELSLTFPNARHYVQKKQWEWAHKPTEKDRESFKLDSIDPLKESGKLELFDGPGKWLPGLEIVVVNGHTTSKQLLYLSNGKTSLLFAGDLVPTSTHIGLPWIMGYDNNPLVTLEEKRYWLKRIHEENGFLFLGHDPEVAMAKLTLDQMGRYQIKDPVKSIS